MRIHVRAARFARRRSQAAWLRQRHPLVMRVLEVLERTQWLTPPDIRSVREERLRTLLRHSEAQVPSYHEAFRRTGMRPEEGSRTLGALPMLTKEIIPSGVDPQEFYFRDQPPRRVAIDLHYVRNWSPGLDLSFLARTLWCLLDRAPWILLLERKPLHHALPPVDDPELLGQVGLLNCAAEPDREPEG
jgi:hypothetical protein